MNKLGNRVGLLLLVTGLGAAGLLYHREQVQQAVLLHEITVVDAALVANNQQAARYNAATVRAIAKEVCRNYNRASDVAVLNQSQQILSRTQTLTDTLRALRRQLQTTGRAIALPELVRHLDRYSDFIRDYVPGTRYLTRPFPGPPDPDWLARLYFNKVPPEAAWATLTKLEALIRRSEADALSQQAQKVGSCCMCFTRIGALAVPTSETVAPGGEYQARLFLAEAISLHWSTMQMTADGRAASMDAEAPLGHVAFTVPPAGPGQPDTVRAQWHGIVRVRMCPTDTVFQVDVPYFIVKPKP